MGMRDESEDKPMTNGAINAAGRVYDALRGAITDRTFRPGDKLSRPDLARRYGTSQTPVREALLRLEQEGFVHVRPQAETVVAPISVLALHQALFLRRALEEGVVRRLAAGAHDMAALHAMAATDMSDETDLAFHHALFEAAGMGALFERIQPLLAPFHRYRALSGNDVERMRAATAEHSDIVERIGLGDSFGAAQAMEAHLSGELSGLGDIRRTYPAFFTEP
jgi:DNA-binding GntR family transcriptional regulator